MGMPVASDAELVKESLGGKAEAFGKIVLRYQSLICSLAYSATGSLSESEDVAQETFLAAWKKLPTFVSRRGYGPGYAASRAIAFTIPGNASVYATNIK